MREGHRLLINAALNTAGQVAGLAAGLVIPPYVIRQVSSEAYGLVVVIGSALQFVTLLQVGIPQVLQRFVSAALATNDVRALGRYLSTGFGLLFMAAALGTAALGLALVRPEWIAQRPPSVSAESLRWVLVLTGIAILVRMPLAIGNVSLYATQRFGLLNATNTLGALLRVGLVFGLLAIVPGSIVAYAGANAAALVAPALVTFWLGRRLIPQGRIRLGLISRETTRETVSYGGEVAFSILSWLLYVQAIYVVLGRSLGPHSVTIFSLAMLWGELIRNVVGFANSVALPAAAGRQARGDVDVLKDMVLRGIKYSLMLGMLPAVLLGVHRDAVIALWLGEGFEEVASILVPLVAAQLMAVAVSGGNVVFLGIGRVRIFTITNAVFAPLAPILAFVCVSVYERDLVFLAWAYCGLHALRSLVVLPLAIARQASLSVFRLYGEGLARPIFSGLALAALSFPITAVFGGESWIGLLLCFGALSLIYPALLYAFAFDAYDRELARSVVRRTTSRSG